MYQEKCIQEWVTHTRINYKSYAVQLLEQVKTPIKINYLQSLFYFFFANAKFKSKNLFF